MTLTIHRPTRRGTTPVIRFDSDEADVRAVPRRPGVLLSRWDAEAWLEMWCADCHPHGREWFDGDILTQQIVRENAGRLTDERHTWTQRRDRLEWDITWNCPRDIPQLGFVDFRVQDSGLDWWFQPRLTPADVASGSMRSTQIVNSYALYHRRAGCLQFRDRTINYACGKFCHLLRPVLIDRLGRRCWTTQRKIGNILRVFLDQQWLASAAWPVTLDPTATIGYVNGGTPGASISAFSADYNVAAGIAAVFTPASSGTATTVSLYVNDLAQKTTIGIYADSSSKPTTVLKDTAEFTPTSLPSWNTQNLDSGLAVSSGTPYWVGQNHDDGTQQLCYDTVVPTNSYYEASTYSAGTLPAFSASPTGLTRIWSMYATYDIAAAGPSIPVLMNSYRRRWGV